MTATKTKGVMYVSYGNRAAEQLRISIGSLRKKSKLPISIVSDKQFAIEGIPLDAFIFRENADPGARTWKTQIYGLTPYDMTLFLDVDTEILTSPDAGFKLLEYVDMVLAQDVTRIFAENKWPHLNQEEVKTTIAEIGSAGQHMYFNSGVIFFNKSPQVEKVMEAWHREWKRWKEHDQMALLRAIHQHPIRIAPMRAPWNTHVKASASFVYHKHRAARREGSPR